MVHCPKCNADVSDSYQGAEPDVGIMSSGYYCDACDLPIDDDHEPMDDDVQIEPAPACADGLIGTPLSALSGRPGFPGYETFKRIARSWGFD
jgi:hypothetical protein